MKQKVLTMLISVIVLFGLLAGALSINNAMNTYNSPEDFFEKHKYSFLQLDILGRFDGAVIYEGHHSTRSGTTGKKILVKIKEGKWRDVELKQSYVAYRIPNEYWNRCEMYYIRINDSVIMSLIASESSLPQEVSLASDTANGVLHKYVYKEYVQYFSYVEHFDKTTYILFYNGKAYPYIKWEQIFERR